MTASTALTVKNTATTIMNTATTGVLRSMEMEEIQPLGFRQNFNDATFIDQDLSGS